MHVLETSKKYNCWRLFVPVWCPEGNTQTILTALFPKREKPICQREEIAKGFSQ